MVTSTCQSLVISFINVLGVGVYNRAQENSEVGSINRDGPSSRDGENEIVEETKEAR